MKIIQPIEPKEVRTLSRKYGVPRRVVWTLREWPMPRIPSGDPPRALGGGGRTVARGDRRGEVVFAIMNRKQKILLHTKSFYPDGVFRLLGGGIHWDEKVEDALYREVAEETGLSVQVERFVGVIEYEVRRKCQPFATYVFLLNSNGMKPSVQDANEDIAALKAVTRAELGETTHRLRRLPEKWRVWGEFRAVAHELVVEVLAKDER